MDCPKCGAEARGGPQECTSCGVIFARYSRPGTTARGRDIIIPKAPDSAPPANEGRGLLLGLFVFLIAVAGIVFYVRQTGNNPFTKYEDHIFAVLGLPLVIGAIVVKLFMLRNARL